MEEGMNGHFKDGAHQNVEEDGIKADFDDETQRMGTVVAEGSFEVKVTENGVGVGKEEKDLASSSSSSSDDEESEIIDTVKTDDEEAEVVVTEKTDDETGFTSAEVYDKEENGASELIVEEAAEIDSSPVTEELKVVKAIEEDISEVVETAAEEKRYTAEEEREVVITGVSHAVEAVVVELADVVSDHVESAEEVLSTVVKEREVEYADQDGTEKLQSEEYSFPAIAKPRNGINDTNHKTEIPETNGNPIISISARTMQPTSWMGCCGLLELFKRGDR